MKCISMFSQSDLGVPEAGVISEKHEAHEHQRQRALERVQ